MENLQKLESKYKHDQEQRKIVIFHRGKDKLTSRKITLWIIGGMKKVRCKWKTEKYFWGKENSLKVLQIRKPTIRMAQMKKINKLGTI